MFLLMYAGCVFRLLRGCMIGLYSFFIQLYYCSIRLTYSRTYDTSAKKKSCLILVRTVKLVKLVNATYIYASQTQPYIFAQSGIILLILIISRHSLGSAFGAHDIACFIYTVCTRWLNAEGRHDATRDAKPTKETATSYIY